MVSEASIFIFNVGIFIIYMLFKMLSHTISFLNFNLFLKQPAPETYNLFSKDEIDAINCTSGVVVIGGLGVGKSTLLNTIIGKPVFVSGFSAATVLSQTSKAHIHNGVCYIDTPGMGGRDDQNNALSMLQIIFRLRAPLKIVFLIVLQSGRVRNEDTLLIEEALDLFAKQQSRGMNFRHEKLQNNFGVIVNQLPLSMIKTLLSDSSAEQALQNAITRKYKTNNWLYLPSASQLTHARNAIFLYEDSTKSFVSHLRASGHGNEIGNTQSTSSNEEDEKICISGYDTPPQNKEDIKQQDWVAESAFNVGQTEQIRQHKIVEVYKNVDKNNLGKSRRLRRSDREAKLQKIRESSRVPRLGNYDGLQRLEQLQDLHVAKYQNSAQKEACSSPLASQARQETLQPQQLNVLKGSRIANFGLRRKSNFA